MAVYQTKTFARWAKKAGLRDAELYTAAQEVVVGQVEAKLGGNLYKKRVALRLYALPGCVFSFE